MIPEATKDFVVRRFLKGGLTVEQAASGFCSRDTLRMELVKRGIPRGPKGHRGQQNPHRDEAMLAHHEAGIGYPEIGRLFGITRTGALLACRRAREARRETA